MGVCEWTRDTENDVLFECEGVPYMCKGVCRGCSIHVKFGIAQCLLRDDLHLSQPAPSSIVHVSHLLLCMYTPVLHFSLSSRFHFSVPNKVTTSRNHDFCIACTCTRVCGLSASPWRLLLCKVLVLCISITVVIFWLAFPVVCFQPLSWWLINNNLSTQRRCDNLTDSYLGSVIPLGFVSWIQGLFVFPFFIMHDMRPICFPPIDYTWDGLILMCVGGLIYKEFEAFISLATKLYSLGCLVVYALRKCMTFLPPFLLLCAGSPPSKVYGQMRAVASRAVEKF